MMPRCVGMQSIALAASVLLTRWHPLWAAAAAHTVLGLLHRQSTALLRAPPLLSAGSSAAAPAAAPLAAAAVPPPAPAAAPAAALLLPLLPPLPLHHYRHRRCLHRSHTAAGFPATPGGGHRSPLLRWAGCHGRRRQGRRRCGRHHHPAMHLHWQPRPDAAAACMLLQHTHTHKHESKLSS